MKSDLASVDGWMMVWTNFVIYKSLVAISGFCWPRDGGHDDNAHPPITPVKPGALEFVTQGCGLRVRCEVAPSMQFT
eukprot:6198516-Pleurochrysis_carterae.AAC.1